MYSDNNNLSLNEIMLARFMNEIKNQFIWRKNLLNYCNKWAAKKVFPFSDLVDIFLEKIFFWMIGRKKKKKMRYERKDICIIKRISSLIQSYVILTTSNNEKFFIEVNFRCEIYQTRFWFTDEKTNQMDEQKSTVLFKSLWTKCAYIWIQFVYFVELHS